jgi:hypothetical protein
MVWEEDMNGNELGDLLAWLRVNREHYADYSPEEIADYADACGFSKLAINQWLLLQRLPPIPQKPLPPKKRDVRKAIKGEPSL